MQGCQGEGGGQDDLKLNPTPALLEARPCKELEATRAAERKDRDCARDYQFNTKVNSSSGLFSVNKYIFMYVLHVKQVKL